MKNEIIYGECCSLKMLNEDRVKRKKKKYPSVNVEREDMLHGETFTNNCYDVL